MSEHFRAEQISGRVAADLRRGRDRSEIIAELEAMGASPDEAAAVVDRIAAHVKPAARARSAPQPAPASEATSKVLQVILLIVAFAVLNGGLWVGQGFIKRDDVARAEELERQLQEMQSTLSVLEVELDGYQRRSDQIDSLGMAANRSGFVSSRPSYDQRRHERLVDEWNAALPAMNRIVARHDSIVTVYNQQVDAYNAIAEKAYSRWVLIPGVGRPGRRIDPD